MITMYDVKSVLKSIESARVQANLRKEDLARGVGRTKGWYTQIMAILNHPNPKRQVRLSVEALLKMAEVLNVTPGSLLPGPNPAKNPSPIDLDDYIRGIVRDEIVKKQEK